MEIVKITKKVYKVTNACIKAFTKFGHFREIREKKNLSVQRKCFYCGRKFKDEDDIYLVSHTGVGNKLYCKECNDKALKYLNQHNNDGEDRIIQ